MAQPAGPTDKRHQPEPETVAVDRAADRSGNWMMFAMVACCAAIPVALLIAAIAGGSAVGDVAPWAWALLVGAFVSAMAVAVRTMLRHRSR